MNEIKLKSRLECSSFLYIWVPYDDNQPPKLLIENTVRIELQRCKDEDIEIEESIQRAIIIFPFNLQLIFFYT